MKYSLIGKNNYSYRDNGIWFTFIMNGYNARYIKDSQQLIVFDGLEKIKEYKIEQSTEWYYKILKTKIKCNMDKIIKDYTKAIDTNDNFNLNYLFITKLIENLQQ